MIIVVFFIVLTLKQVKGFFRKVNTVSNVFVSIKPELQNKALAYYRELEVQFSRIPHRMDKN